MKASASNKGFTLVELIVVITILAILGTIGFISLQGYSGQSRDSKRTSDLRSLSTAVTVKNTEGVSYLSFVTPVTGSQLTGTGLQIAGIAAGLATEYNAGTPNFTALALSPSNFNDPSSATPYRIGASSRAGGVFQIAAKLENAGTAVASVTGTFNSRPGTLFPTAEAAALGATQVTMTSAAPGNFIKGDVVKFSAGATGTYVISAVSGDGLTLTFTTGLVGAAAPAATNVSLNVADTAGLIASTTSTLIGVTSNSTNLPY